MAEALAAVKRALGPDAVILGTRSVPGSTVGRLVGRERFEIAAAPPPPGSHPELTGGAPVGQPTSRRSGLPGAPTPSRSGSSRENPRVAPPPPHLRDEYVRLVRNEVAADLARRILATAAESSLPAADAVADAVRRHIVRLVPAAGGIQIPAGQRRVVAFVGPAGGGKTTTIAKLAARFKLRQHLGVGVLSLDTDRPAADEQLRRYADVLGVPSCTAQSVAEVQNAMQRFADCELVLIDTPGVSLAAQAPLARLAGLLQAARPDEVHLVLPVCLAQSVQVRARRVFAPFQVRRVVLTRLDDAVGLGVVLTALDRLKLDLSYLSDGQNVPRDLREPCGEDLARLIIPRGVG